HDGIDLESIIDPELLKTQLLRYLEEEPTGESQATTTDSGEIDVTLELLEDQEDQDDIQTPVKLNTNVIPTSDVLNVADAIENLKSLAGERGVDLDQDDEALRPLRSMENFDQAYLLFLVEILNLPTLERIHLLQQVGIDIVEIEIIEKTF